MAQYDTQPEMSIDLAKTYAATLHTNHGDISIEFDAMRSPMSVNNFVFLAREGFYDGVIFHRVIENFMIQGGDPTGTGSGGPGYKFGDEFHPDLKHTKAGIFSMANAGPGTNGSQFFVTHGPTPHLNGKHSVFGEVTSGQNVVDSIAQGDKIVSITIHDDISGLLESQKDNVEHWNSILGK